MPAHFPSAWLDELRARCDIVQVVSGYVSLKKSGRKHWGLCPFHGEKTASFSVDGEQQLYYCFGCKAGGNVIHFIMGIERLSFPEAVELLAERVHLPLPQMERDEDYEKRRTQRQRLQEANRAAARFYHETLFTAAGAASLNYLKKRGLSDGVIRRFGLGAAPDLRTFVSNHLLSAGYTEEELILAGLAVRSSHDGKLRDMFRNRAIFPIIDQYGNVLAFGGRALGDAQPKYLNTADTPVFNKRKGVYAANLLKKQRNLERVILVEGYMDVVSLSQFGVEGVCATLGTALTNEQARLLHRFAPKVYLAYDGDSAGQHAILRGLGILAEENVEARVLDFPDGLDPDEFVRRDGAEGFRSLPVLTPADYRLRRLKETSDLSTQEGRVAYARAALAILSPLDPVERESHLKDLSVSTGFPRETLLEQLRMMSKAPQEAAVSPFAPPARRRKEEKPPVQDESLQAQELLLSLLATGQIPEDIVREEDFGDDELKSLYRSLASGKSPAALIDETTDDDSRSRYTRILLSPTAASKDEMITMAQDCVRRIRRAVYERQYRDLMARIASCPENEKSLLLREAQDLNLKLKQL